MTPCWRTAGVTLWQGNALDVLRGLPAASVDCCALAKRELAKVRPLFERRSE